MAVGHQLHPPLRRAALYTGGAMQNMSLLFAHLGPALVWLDILGIAVFAISGALAAAHRKQNLVTFAFFAAGKRSADHTFRVGEEPFRVAFQEVSTWDATRQKWTRSW